MVILPLCSIYSNSGHFCSSMDMPDTNYNLRTPVMLMAKFGLNQFSSFRGEDFFKSLRTDGRTDDGRKAMTKAYMALWAR